MSRVEQKVKRGMAHLSVIGKSGRASQHGFTYLAALFLVAALGVTATATSMLWSVAQQRDRERELLFVGNQFRAAIAQYYKNTPGSVKRYPAELNDLLKDNRQLAMRRYLRRIYLDPMTGTTKWGEVRATDGGIMGVYSLSEAAPMKVGNFSDEDRSFSGKGRYSEWTFVYEPLSDEIGESGNMRGTN